MGDSDSAEEPAVLFLQGGGLIPCVHMIVFCGIGSNRRLKWSSVIQMVRIYAVVAQGQTTLRPRASRGDKPCEEEGEALSAKPLGEDGLARRSAITPLAMSHPSV